MLEFHDSTDAAAVNAVCLITNKFVIKTNAFFAAIASVLVMKFKALEQLISSWSNHGAWLDHESLLLILKLIVDCGQCVRVCPWTYAYTLAAIHAVNMRDGSKIFYQLHL